MAGSCTVTLVSVWGLRLPNRSHVMRGWIALLFYAGAALFAHSEVLDSELEVKPLSDANWTSILAGEWMVKFYAPWCPACQQILPDWENFAKKGPLLGVRVGKVDVTQEPGLSGRFFVTTLPTIFHARDGVFHRYHGSRTTEDLQSYIKEKKWEVVEPVPGWKSPSSFLMTGMSGLFRLSAWIRQIHSYFTETHGIPAWGSYLIFALIILLTGLFFGLILVLLADCICPQKPRYKVIKSDVNEKSLEHEVNEEQEDISDEKQHISEGEEERLNVNDKTAAADGGADEKEKGVTVEDVPDQPPPDKEKEDESTVRQRKPQSETGTS
ncbi:thioredoxin-related transmembrane protein 4 [Protopterus annectens]|uniref:thioredoxin-related transmembrane protein 4 n=1 Tax=Protopterus annectens TaxID=7888 RepID=UPI001CFB0637|nr:thioredoxin-related transmembrane protein 4 [Protopterus annectens]